MLSGTTRERAVPGRWLLSLACMITLSSPLGTVQAGNDEGILVGTQAAQMAAAVTATVSDGAAVWYNPSGLANTTASSLDASLTSYTARFIRVDDLLEGPDNSTGAKYTDWVVVPSLVSHVLKISRRWRFSYAVIVPRAENYSIGVTLRTPDGTRWQVLQEEHSQELDIGVGVGGHLLPNLRIGFSMFGVYDTDHLLTSAFAGNPQDPSLAVSALVVEDSSDFGLSARAGLQWDAVEDITLGLAVIAPTMVLMRSDKNTGSVFTPASDGGQPLQQFDRSKDTEATFHASGTPQLRMGGAYRYQRGHVALDCTLNFPLSIAYSQLDRKFSWNLRGGLQHRLSDTFILGAGLFTDRNPVRRIGLDFYGLTVGVAFTKVYGLSKGGALNLMTSLNARYAFGYGTVTGSRVPALADAVGGLSFDSVSSDAWVNEVGLSLGAGVRY